VSSHDANVEAGLLIAVVGSELLKSLEGGIKDLGDNVHMFQELQGASEGPASFRSIKVMFGFFEVRTNPLTLALNLMQSM
jgi:hypothetical protein